MRWLRRNLITIIGILVLIYLFIPIAVVTALSFNKPAGKFNLSWNELSFNAWTNLCGVPGVCSSFVTSLEIGLVSTLIATLLGTMIAFALVRYRFRGRSTTNLIIFLPMATPEVVMGSSLLALFLNLRFPLGSVTVAIAHIMFIISFVVVTVKARLQGLDQFRCICGIVLPVAVQGDDDVATGRQHARPDGPALACVGAVAQHPQRRDLGLEGQQAGPGVVPAAVVNEQDFKTVPGEGGGDFAGQVGGGTRLIEHRNHHRHLGLRGRPASFSGGLCGGHGHVPSYEVSGLKGNDAASGSC